MSLLWNPSLSDLSGLSRLTSIPSDLAISGSPAVSSLSPGLDALTTVGINLVISSMAGLKDLTGLGERVQMGAWRAPHVACAWLWHPPLCGGGRTALTGT